MSLTRTALHFAAVAAAATLPVLAAIPAAEAINCRGAYQISGGREISTPYCEDNYLASVARSYGSRVSSAEIRNNPSTKREVCRFIGHDTRVQHICQGWRDGADGFLR
ncbi:MAG: hypothetical protein JNM89_09090 [Hyphomicrobiaceae bacterium]|nr:hypothetical protein [Hyphomicrobiaceae bacterium]